MSFNMTNTILCTNYVINHVFNFTTGLTTIKVKCEEISLEVITFILIS